jgi:PHO85 cyclin-5
MHSILPLNGPSNSTVFTTLAQQLPSPPITPPYLPGTASSPHVSTAPRLISRAASHNDISSAEQARGSTASLKTFVHEVLRRSRTSCSVLQTAVCYVEALRPTILELVRQEQTGEGIRGEIDQGVRVLSQDDPRLLESPKEVDIDELIDPVHFSSEGQFSDDAPPTVRMLDDGLLTMPDATVYQVEKKSRTSSEDLPSLPPLPSPLLCPRRTFLASLILASKFMQDKCYSNRAWAKLAGLPAREIGRCERALGEALGWRLWVGKMPAYCKLPRSQSAGEFCRVSNEANVRLDAPSPAANVVRRSSTLPAAAFSFSAMATQPVNPSTTRLQGRWMPTPEATAFEYSPTPTLSASPATTDASSDSLSEERTVQMNFVDHVADPDSLKGSAPAGLPALAYAYAGEGGISRAWCGFAWNATGRGSGWVRGEADTLPVQSY